MACRKCHRYLNVSVELLSTKSGLKHCSKNTSCLLRNSSIVPRTLIETINLENTILDRSGINAQQWAPPIDISQRGILEYFKKVAEQFFYDDLKFRACFKDVLIVHAR